jgi:hypothetical protein
MSPGRVKGRRPDPETTLKRKISENKKTAGEAVFLMSNIAIIREEWYISS